MMTRKFLWALLPVAAVLLMTACGGDDTDDVTPTPTPNPVTPGTENVVKSVPYTVTVNTGNVTRTSVDGDITLKFEEKDKLYVQNSNGTVYGCLELKDGEGETSATFAGTVNYTGSTPAASTALTATLVGEDNELNMIGADEKVKDDEYISYPGTVCMTMLEAVQKYSWIRGTGTYGGADFTLEQETAFLKFNVTLEDGTTGGNSVDVVIKSNGSTIGSGSTVATGSQFSALATFVLPLKKSTTIDANASMWVGSVGTEDDESITFGTGTDVTLTGGKVYPVTRTKDFVRLWAGGPVWATYNLGAGSVTYYGKYYAWGEVKGFKEGDVNKFYWDNYKYSEISGDIVTLTKYNATDEKTTLETGDDAVRNSSLGSSWCMPTGTDFSNLVTETTYAWTTVSGLTGGKFTGKGDYAGNAMFLRAGGYRKFDINETKDNEGCYWSSTLTTDIAQFPQYARFLIFNSTKAQTSSYLRCNGRLIRPVKTSSSN